MAARLDVDRRERLGLDQFDQLLLDVLGRLLEALVFLQAAHQFGARVVLLLVLLRPGAATACAT
jgi:hypothetical protein